MRGKVGVGETGQNLDLGIYDSQAPVLYGTTLTRRWGPTKYPFQEGNLVRR